jgi:hypothetical protein
MPQLSSDIPDGTEVRIWMGDGLPDGHATVLDKCDLPCSSCGGQRYHIETQAGLLFACCASLLRVARAN